VTTALPDPLPTNPLPLVRRWIDDAEAAVRNATAMTLATTALDGSPSARMVICRGFDHDVGWFVFYSDQTSPKGRELARVPRAALVFYWQALERQVRVEGPVTLAPAADADRYWVSRPLDARIAAVVSEQSEPIASRAALVERFDAARARLGSDVGRPDRWSGYRVWAERVELWVSQPARLHDRASWSRTLTPAGDGFVGGAWRSTRLQP
jgi:pyridoxamine 5'-phosphate oxidase